MANYSEIKSVCCALDAAAGRAEIAGLTGATSKQCWFLAKLLTEAGKDAADVGCQITCTQAVLTKKSASRYIDDLLAA